VDALEFLEADPLPEARKRIVDRVGVGVDGEGRKVTVFPPELVHIALHDERIEPYEGDALLDLVVGVRGGRQCSRDIVTGFVGHLLHAQGKCESTSPEATWGARNAAAPEPQAASSFTASLCHGPIQSPKKAPS
jgi:hypothetical protein